MGRVRNYNKTILYRIVDKRYNITIYIGHTTNLYEKKKHIKRNKYGINNFVLDNGGWTNYEILYLECYPNCSCKDHAEAIVFRRSKELGIPDEDNLEKIYKVYG